MADMNQAALEARRGNSDEALRLYQRTLQLDATNNDKAASAVDWFAYGRFLDESGFPERLAYACMVKAESEAQSLPDSPLRSSVVASRIKIEKPLGALAATVRRNPEPALQEALQLRR